MKEYEGGYRAVDDVSFRVERGQVVGLLGPNGAGKTTALRVLVGLITPTSGAVHVFGQPIVPGAPVLARVGAFIEGPGIPAAPHRPGEPAAVLGGDRPPEGDADFDTALEIAGLGRSIDRRVRTYSHGMKQRLGIAQAMLGLPELLVLDEPTNGLDPPQIAEMREVLQGLRADRAHRRRVEPPARRGRADLHARGRHAQGTARRGRHGARSPVPGACSSRWPTRPRPPRVLAAAGHRRRIGARPARARGRLPRPDRRT